MDMAFLEIPVSVARAQIVRHVASGNSISDNQSARQSEGCKKNESQAPRAPRDAANAYLGAPASTPCRCSWRRTRFFSCGACPRPTSWSTWRSSCWFEKGKKTAPHNQTHFQKLGTTHTSRAGTPRRGGVTNASKITIVRHCQRAEKGSAPTTAVRRPKSGQPQRTPSTVTSKTRRWLPARSTGRGTGVAARRQRFYRQFMPLKYTATPLPCSGAHTGRVVGRDERTLPGS